MKVLLINGSPNAKGCTYTGLMQVAKSLEAAGIETEIYQVGKKAVQGCIACGYCKTNFKCAFSDGVNDILARADEFDGMVIGTPVYYAAASGQVTAFCNRLFYASRGKFQGKVGACLVSCRRGGAASAFDQLNKYFTINGMPMASSSYWNQIHGNTPEEVVQDLEGMQTLEILGDNMAWLMKCIEAGKQAGIEMPVIDRNNRIATNFIR